MTLQNPLGPLSLEATQQLMLTACQAMVDAAAATERAVSIMQRGGPSAWARDASGALRVTTSPSVAMQWANFNSYASWYSTGAPTSMDGRQQQTEAARTPAILNRNRWTFS